MEDKEIIELLNIERDNILKCTRTYEYISEWKYKHTLNIGDKISFKKVIVDNKKLCFSLKIISKDAPNFINGMTDIYVTLENWYEFIKCFKKVDNEEY